MSITLSQQLARVKPSPTIAVTTLAIKLREQGRDVISLGAGEPDFDTPEHIKAAAISAINAGKTKYTAVDGITELKQAIVDKFERENGLSYSTQEVMVGTGGKQTIYNLLAAMLNPGDEVIIPAPYWVSYPDMVKLCGGEPVIITADSTQQFKITPEQLEAAITPKTRLLFLNSPSNPTGVAYRRSELQALGAVLERHPQVLIATDDMYEHIYWADEPFSNIAMACPALKPRTIVLNGVSKAYSMTGWRIGYVAAPVELVGAMRKIQSQSTSNPCSISQYAALAALNGGLDCVNTMLSAFKARHDYLIQALNGIDGIRCAPGDGTFYAFADVRQAMEKLGIDNDIDFTSMLLDKQAVAVVPGSAFGLDGHMRLSFATSEENLEKSIARIQQAIND